VKIATFNVNNVNRRLPNIVEWLKQSAPDVVCLQELNAEDAAFPEAAFASAGYHAVWKGEKRWNGVAILARDKPIITRRDLPGDETDKQSRYIEAAVQGVIIAWIYLPNGNPQLGPKFEYKLKWFDRLIVHAETLFEIDAPVIIAGDYNVIPTDFDIYNTRSWLRNALLQPESRTRYQQLLDRGWTDALRTLHPGEPMYTFWEYFRESWSRNAGMRLDHFLLNKASAALLKEAGVDRNVRGVEGANDHAPAWIALTNRRKKRVKG